MPTSKKSSRSKRVVPSAAVPPPPPPEPQDPIPPMDPNRQLYRLLKSILIEVRASRQYTQFLHEILANHELGKEAELQGPKEMRRATAEELAKRQKAQDQAFLAARRAAGVGKGGNDLTPEEIRALERGEVPSSLDDLEG